MTRRGEGIGWRLLLEIAPAAIFGCAVAFAAATRFGAALASVVPVVLGAGASGGAWLALRSFRGAHEAFPMPQFEQVAVEPDDRPDRAGGGELLLDDVLAGIGPGARVVRLFDSLPVRSSGRIDAALTARLRSAVRPIPTPPDATEALHEALASLRQSLR